MAAQWKIHYDQSQQRSLLPLGWIHRSDFLCKVFLFRCWCGSLWDLVITQDWGQYNNSKALLYKQRCQFSGHFLISGSLARNFLTSGNFTLYKRIGKCNFRKFFEHFRKFLTIVTDISVQISSDSIPYSAKAISECKDKSLWVSIQGSIKSWNTQDFSVVTHYSLHVIEGRMLCADRFPRSILKGF